MAKSIIYTPPQIAKGLIAFRIEQVGTSNPSIAMLECTIKNALPISAIRASAGNYEFNFHSPILDLSLQNISIQAESKDLTTYLRAGWVTASQIKLINYNGASAVDGISSQTTLIIQIYNMINKNM